MCIRDSPDAARDRVLGVVDDDGHIINEDFARIGKVKSIKDIHQRGLSGSIFTEQTMNFTGLDHEVDIAVRHE